MRRALTDFTDGRLRTWHRTSDPETMSCAISASAGGGGSNLHAEWRYADARRQTVLLSLIQHGRTSMLLSRMWASALNRYAIEDGR